jgi:arylsulfatase A-like enzyme
VFWTDHGEQFAEHGEFYHGVSLHDQENRSTAFFWARNIVPGDWNGPTSHQDIPPTVLAALGMPANEQHTGFVVGEAPDDRARFLFNYIVGWAQPDVGIVKNDYKLLYNYDGTKKFYDLDADPEETTDLYSPTDPRVLGLWRELAPRLAALQAQWPHLTPTNPRP